MDEINGRREPMNLHLLMESAAFSLLFDPSGTEIKETVAANGEEQGGGDRAARKETTALRGTGRGKEAEAIDADHFLRGCRETQEELEKEGQRQSLELVISMALSLSQTIVPPRSAPIHVIIESQPPSCYAPPFSIYC